MSPSRLFILRPVATSLFMAAILLAGAVAYQQLPVSALPEVDYPTIQVTTFYPGASPDVMASSVTAPLERQFGQMPGLKQMTSTSSFGSSVVTLQFDLVARHRHRRAGGAGRGQRERHVPAARSAEPARLQQGEPGRRAGADAGAHVRRRCRSQPGAVARRHAAGAEDLAARRRRAGDDQRRPEAGRPHPGEPDGAGGLRHRPRRSCS